MGKLNSSLTRVQPVFSALCSRDPSGVTWLRPLLEMARRTTGPEPMAIPADVGQLVVPRQFELAVDPPRSFLRWLIEHHKDLSWPGEKAWSKWTEETQKKRRALREENPGVQAEALFELETCRYLPDQAWWRFEGVTQVDCALLTPSTVVFVEGKRTEKGPSKGVTWYQGRNQVLRVLDCAAAFARQTGRPHYFAMLVVEKTLVEGDPDRQREIEAIVSADTVQRSLPHLNSREQVELMSHYLGTTTWQDVVEAFDLGQHLVIDQLGNCAVSKTGSRAMSYRYCPCGHPIGVQKLEDSCLYYDDFDWEKPIETCPTCQVDIEAEKLGFSEEQKKALARAYDLLLDLAERRRSNANHP